MTSWLTIGVVAGIFTALGNAIDRILTIGQKRRLHDKMVAWWVVLAETNFPNLHTRMASSSVSFLKHFVVGKRKVLKFLVISVVGSWLLTSVAFFVGRIIEGGISAPFQGSGVPLPVFTVYLSNFPFDAVTLAVTYIALVVVARSKPIKGLIIIFLDLAVTLVLAVLAWAFIAWAEDLAVTYELPGSEWAIEEYESDAKRDYGHVLTKLGFSENARIRMHQLNEKTGFQYYLRIAPEAFYSALHGKPVSQEFMVKYEVFEGERVDTFWLKTGFVANPSEVALALTTLVPTALYLVYLAFLLVGRMMVEALRLGSMQFFEVATEACPDDKPKDFIPGTLFGAVIGVLAAIANGVVKVFGQ